MPNVFQLPEVQRTDSGKNPVFLRIDESGENHGCYSQREAANQAGRRLDYLEV